MKMIIDIDDEMVCNDIKNKALEPTSETDKVIINALYNGTPVSNEGDLISREALKKALEDYEAYSDIIPKEVYDFIDNAPTVPLPDFKEGYKQAIIDGKTNFSRPPGEFTRKELESWLYKIAGNNLNNELGRSCEEIIKRLDGFEWFVSDMRKGGTL